MSKQLPIIPDNVRTHDNSMMETWERCPRLYDVRHNRHFAPRRVRTALNYGNLVHLGLADWYENGDHAHALQTMLDAPYEEDKGDAFLGTSSDFRTKARAVETMHEYIEYYGDESKFDISEVILTETPFRLEDPSGFRWGGKIDSAVVYRGEPWVLDHKTTSRFGGEGYWAQFMLSSQMGGYVWAARQLGAPVKGVIINCIVTRKKVEPPHMRFHRRPIPYPDWKVNEWKAMTIQRYREIEHAQDTDTWRPRWDNCYNKYGKCDMHDVCKKKVDQREGTFNADFEPRIWDWMDPTGDSHDAKRTTDS